MTKTCHYKQAKSEAERMKIITRHHLPFKKGEIFQKQDKIGKIQCRDPLDQNVPISTDCFLGISEHLC